MSNVSQLADLRRLIDARGPFNDDGADGPVTTELHGATPAGACEVDAVIAAAIRTDADVTVIPRVAALQGPIVALYRW